MSANLNRIDLAVTTNTPTEAFEELSLPQIDSELFLGFEELKESVAYVGPKYIIVYSFDLADAHKDFFNWQPRSSFQVYIPRPSFAPDHNRSLAERLCVEHQAISTYPGIFGGMPHIKGLRFSVADVLSNLYVLGSIENVEKAFAPDLTKEQIKEAIAYAQDFIESALSP